MILKRVQCFILFITLFNKIHFGQSRALNKTDESLEEKKQKNKILARWIMEKETNLKLDIDKLKPAEHLEAVKMKQDGSLNGDYQREIFLGNHEHDLDTEVEIILKDVFKKADVDMDRLLSLSEMEDWIGMKIEEHLDEAEGGNSRIFNLLDLDHDGFISWTEYLKQFLLVHGHDSERAEKHILGQQLIHLDQTDKMELDRYRSRWDEADKDQADKKLSEREFLTFRHPEHSDAMLDVMANEIMNALDRDYNGSLSLREFIALPETEVIGTKDMEMDKHWQTQRSQEFTEVIDVNKDYHVSLQELKDYLNPRHPSHAKSEALNLIKMADENKDSHLSLEEIMKNKAVLLGSKMIDTGRSFHDEF